MIYHILLLTSLFKVRNHVSNCPNASVHSSLMISRIIFETSVIDTKKKMNLMTSEEFDAPSVVFLRTRDVIE